MKNNSLFSIKGLKCDNPQCNYRDMNIKVGDYKKYIDCPCPCCGSPLLTKDDYKNVKRIYIISRVAEFLGVKPDGNEVSIEMNGTGKMKFKRK